MFRRVEKERIVCDDDKVLNGSRTFFATRLLQLRLQREGKWDPFIPKAQTRKFSPDASDEEIDQFREKMYRQSNSGNLFLEFIKKQAPPESEMDLQDYIFGIGVAELNNLMISREADGQNIRRP